MKYLLLIRKNITRKKTRMLLTLGSFAVALFLFGLLVTLNDAFYAGVEMAGADRLITKNKAAVGMFLPYSYKEKILKLPGVKAVTPSSWFGGIYQDPKNFFVQFALEDEHFRDIYSEYIIPQDQWQAYLKDRQGCIVGQALIERFGWKLGDRIPLKGTIHPGTWEFNIRAIYKNSLQADDTTAMFFHYKYLSEKGVFRGKRVLWFMTKVDKPENASRVAKAIDERFANSSDETITETEQFVQTELVTWMGNIKLILMTVGAIVFFTLLLVTGSTMAMTIRERTGEIGVLKTLGFSDLLVLALVLSESLAYALAGGGLGLTLAKLYTLGGDPTKGMLRIFYLSPGNIAAAILITIATGLAAGILPAVNAMRLNIVTALRRV